MNLCKLIATLLILVPVVTWAAPVKIKFSHVVAENTPKGQAVVKFKELIEQRLPNDVIVEIYPNAQLFGDNKVLEAMLLGDVQMAAPALSKFQKYTKQLQIFDLPFLFDDLQATERFQQGPAGQGLLNSLNKRGLVGLGYLHNGMKQLSAGDPVLTPADAEGKKFRIMTSDVLQEQFDAIDAVPLKKPFAEVFTLLQTKAIDGQENTWSNMYSQKFFEVQEHITETNHGLLDYLVVTSAEFWMNLPKEIREEIQTALNEAISHGNQLAFEYAERDRKAIADSGKSEIHTLTDQQRQLWVDAMRPVWKKFEKEIGSDLINAAIQANNP